MSSSRKEEERMSSSRKEEERNEKTQSLTIQSDVESNDLSVPGLQQTEGGSEVLPRDWVACDRCEKWRLLPIGIDPSNLPEKWQCRMSTWLPGKNHCDISEDETTRAVLSGISSSHANQPLLFEKD